MLHYRIKKAFDLFKGAVRWLQQNDIAFTRLLESWKIIKNWNAPLESKNVQDVHVLSATMHYSVNVPGHDPRSESDVFRATKKQLIDVQNVGCIVCGSDENREIHHYHLEYSLQNGTDWGKMKKLHPDFQGWDKVNPQDNSTFKHFVDSVYNCRVLCATHYCLVGQGIHAIPFPLWNFLLVKRDDFDFINVDSKDMTYVDDLD